MKRILTGIQPSGNLTLGNYVGAIKQMLKLQEEANKESFVFIADLHAITVYQNPQELKKNIRDLLLIYLACGLDPKKNVIYLQSDIEFIPAVSWILECNTGYGELQRMTQFKDKSKKAEAVTSGLLTYPVLMAADILAVDSDFVPVGADQKQHVELARNIAQNFNKKYGEIFKIPQPQITDTGTKIKDLQDASKKMSKSSKETKGVIYLLEEENSVRKKIMSAKTDSGSEIIFDEKNKPEISNLLNIYSSLTNLSVKDLETKYKGSTYAQFKKDLCEVVVSALNVIKIMYEEFSKSDDILKILEENKAKVNAIVKAKYDKMRQFMGLK